MSYLSALRISINDKLLKLEKELSATNQDEGPHLLEANPYPPLDDADNLPSPEIFTLIDRLRLDLKAVDSLITPSRFKLVEQATTHYTVAALSTAVHLNVADAIASFGGEATLADLAARLAVNEHKLGRVLRTLAGEFIFREAAPGVFTNTRHSAALAGSKGARSFLSFITGLGMRCSGGICEDVVSPATRDSFAEETAPFCRTAGSSSASGGLTFAQYMADPANGEMVELGQDGIVGWLNKLTRASLLNDYPWQRLGEATVVDLGAGMGDSGVDVMRKYPGQFRWVYQDLEPVIDMLKEGVPEDLRPQFDDGTISFVVQDYFQPNVSDGEVWYMRGVLHEYDDSQVHQLLTHLAAAIRRQRQPSSCKLLINEVLNSSPTIIPTADADTYIPSSHVPERQSAMASTANTMTWSTFSLFGGKERSYDEYDVLIRGAGFRIERLWKFRTFTVMIEAVLAE